MSEPFLGEIKMVGFNFPPRGWSTCDGQLLPISQNTALFSLLGTTFGGDGRTTFALPDLRGRTALHVGTGPGLSPTTWGERGGTENVTLTVNEIPSHTHGSTGLKVGVSSDDANSDDPAGSVFGVTNENAFVAAAADEEMGATSVQGTIDPTGGTRSHTNMQPYLGIYHVIAMVGLFPSRS